MPEEELPNLMRTLLAAGFDVTRVDRKPNYLALTLGRPDAFGRKYASKLTRSRTTFSGKAWLLPDVSTNCRTRPRLLRSASTRGSF